MKSNARHMALSILILITSVVVSACSGVDYSVQFSDISALADPGTTQNVGNKKYEFTKMVSAVETSPAPLDLVWVIDNSGSMKEEAQHVRANFSSFIDKVGAQSDLKVALISQTTGGYGVAMPTPNSIRFQIDYKVKSTDSLQLVASALCNSDVRNCSNLPKPDVRGKLVPFVRQNSKKVIIVVSDDRSEMSEGVFLSEFSKAFPNQKPTFFGFVGLGPNTSPCQADTGFEYISLAATNGGRVYNICDADWTSRFNDLIKRVIDTAVPVIAFPHAGQAIKLIQISLDGVQLRETDYSVGPDGIRLDKSLFSQNGPRLLKVVYELQ